MQGRDGTERRDAGPQREVGAVTRAAALAALLLAAASGARAERAEVTVLAAASLAQAFAEIGARFDEVQPSYRARLSFGGSSALAAQILEGARADAFAAADERSMARVESLLAAPAAVFAANRLAIAVARGNPKAVRGLADLARPDLVVVLGQPELPAGRYAAAALARAGVRVAPRSLEPSVRAVVARVAAGEADAGIAYATDLRADAGAVQGVAIPDDQNERACYPIAVLRGSLRPEGARAFADFVLAPAGQAILRAHGFEAP